MKNITLVSALSIASLLIPGIALAGSVNLDKTVLQWTGKKKVGDSHTGKLKLKSAKVERSQGKLKSATFVVDMNGLTNEDLKGEWRAKLLGHLKSADFFDTAKFPTATLKLNRHVDNDTVSGKLTVKGKTQPVEIDYKENSTGTLTGTLSFDRTQFGVIYGSGNFFKGLGDKIIDDQIQVKFTVVLDGAKSSS